MPFFFWHTLYWSVLFSLSKHRWNDKTDLETHLACSLKLYGGGEQGYYIRSQHVHNHKLPAHVTLLDDVSDVHEVWSLENVQWGSLINNLNDWNVFTLQGVNKDNWRTRNLKPKCGYDGEFYAIRQRKPVNRTSSISLFTLGGVILPKICLHSQRNEGLSVNRLIQWETSTHQPAPD